MSDCMYEMLSKLYPLTIYMPLVLAPVVFVYCVIGMFRWSVFRGRYLFAAIVCAMYTLAHSRWISLSIWDVVTPEYKLDRVMWDVIEFLLIIAILMLARIPKDAGFR